MKSLFVPLLQQLWHKPKPTPVLQGKPALAGATNIFRHFLARLLEEAAFLLVSSKAPAVNEDATATAENARAVVSKAIRTFRSMVRDLPSCCLAQVL